MKRATIKDIAKHLTISVSTVSRALNDDKNIRSETRQRVLEAAKELGYQPNPIATNLKFGKTNTVGVIVPEMTTPFASQVIGGVQEVLTQHGIKVIIAESHESWEQERENIETMKRFMVDGILVSLCDYIKNREIYLQLIDKGMPIIFFDRIPHKMNVSQVIVDDYIKSFFLTEHLLRSGYKRIVHLEGPAYVHNSVERTNGYKAAIKKFNADNSPELIIRGGLSFADGASAVDKLLADGVQFDALFAFTDTLAIGAMNRLREVGVSVPDQVAVASFSGTVLATIVNPPLTSVEPPLRQMGHHAATLIVEKINHPSSPIRSIVLDAEIVLRSSTEKQSK